MDNKKRVIIELNNHELMILRNAINFSQSNAMVGLERLKESCKDFQEWKIETMEELIILQKIKKEIEYILIKNENNTNKNV